MFFTPFITVPIVWIKSKRSKVEKIFIGIGLAIVLSFILFAISFSILLRNGLGP